MATTQSDDLHIISEGMSLAPAGPVDQPTHAVQLIRSATPEEHNDVLWIDHEREYLRQLHHERNKKKPASLGVICHDHNQAPSTPVTDPGPDANPSGYQAHYRTVPGLTFEMCKRGKMTSEVEAAFVAAVQYLDQCMGVTAITSDCGFMYWFQGMARERTTKPIFLSSLVSLPSITSYFSPSDQMLILTANTDSLMLMQSFVAATCGVQLRDEKYIIRDCQGVSGFDDEDADSDIVPGHCVDVTCRQQGVVARAEKVAKENPRVRGILLEYTALRPYREALRNATGLPVYDAMTTANALVNGLMDNPRFGPSVWARKACKHATHFLSNAAVAAVSTLEAAVQQQCQVLAASQLSKNPPVSLGVLRLDYDYPPAPGDVDHPSSFGYQVYYQKVAGLTFQMCQKGVLTDPVKQAFIAAIHHLDTDLAVAAITGDCGFMYWFQGMAREHTTKPIFLSSLVSLPSITACFGCHDQVAIFTANSNSLQPMESLIAESCGVRLQDDRYVIVGCQKVPGFDAVEKAEKMDVRSVTPHIVDLATQTVAEFPNIRAILLECTELPPYADALRYAVGLPVYDAITTSDTFVHGFMNAGFGRKDTDEAPDHPQGSYVLSAGQHPESAAEDAPVAAASAVVTPQAQMTTMMVQ